MSQYGIQNCLFELYFKALWLSHFWFAKFYFSSEACCLQGNFKYDYFYNCIWMKPHLDFLLMKFLSPLLDFSCNSLITLITMIQKMCKNIFLPVWSFLLDTIVKMLTCGKLDSLMPKFSTSIQTERSNLVSKVGTIFKLASVYIKKLERSIHFTGGGRVVEMWVKGQIFPFLKNIYFFKHFFMTNSMF